MEWAHDEKRAGGRPVSRKAGLSVRDVSRKDGARCRAQMSAFAAGRGDAREALREEAASQGEGGIHGGHGGPGSRGVSGQRGLVTAQREEAGRARSCGTVSNRRRPEPERPLARTPVLSLPSRPPC